MRSSDANWVLGNLSGTEHLMACLLYGSGLRLTECISLRINDLDFDRHLILVRQGKGEKDRVTMLPRSSLPSRCRQLEAVQEIHGRDLSEDYTGATLSESLERKYPTAPGELAWQYVFPASRRCAEPTTGRERRHDIDENVLQRAVKVAILRSGIPKIGSCHTFRHAFATRLLELGYDIRTVQELLGHSDVRTTMIYVRVLTKGGIAVRSPLGEP